MRSNRINYIAVGLFVVLAVAGLVVAVGLLTGRTGPTDEYFTTYDNVSGVRNGTPVRFEGYRVGQVDRVEPVTEGGNGRGIHFRVTFAVERGFPIPEDSRAVIASAGLLAGSSIEIRAGEASEMLPPGERIEAGPSADPYATLSRLAGQVENLNLDAVQPLLDTVTLYVEAVGQTLLESTPRVLNDLETVTESLRDTAPGISRNADAFLRTLNERLLAQENLERFDRTLRNVEESTQTLNEDVLGVENREQLRGVLSNFEASSRDFASLAADLNRSEETVARILDSLDQMASESREPVRESVEDMRYTLEAVSRNIDSITRNLEGASRNMNEFSRQLRQNPSLLLRGRAAGGE